MSELSHYRKDGSIGMVDVSDKTESKRRALAAGLVLLNPETIKALRDEKNPKGNPLEIARIAGILGAKKTAELIPLCHQINLTNVNVEAAIVENGIMIEAEALTTSKTGVEMEALTAVSIAALTVYDMCKAVQKDIVISGIKLLEKTGGKEDYRRESGSGSE